MMQSCPYIQHDCQKCFDSHTSNLHHSSFTMHLAWWVSNPSLNAKTYFLWELLAWIQSLLPLIYLEWIKPTLIEGKLELHFHMPEFKGGEEKSMSSQFSHLKLSLSKIIFKIFTTFRSPIMTVYPVLKGRKFLGCHSVPCDNWSKLMKCVLSEI